VLCCVVLCVLFLFIDFPSRFLRTIFLDKSIQYSIGSLTSTHTHTHTHGVDLPSILLYEYRGWLELFSSLFQIFVWIIALSILTAIDGIAATTNGYNCLPDLFHSIPATDPVDLPPPTSEYAMINCTTLNNGIEEACHVRRLMPGSNLYFACWTCMLSAVAIAFKWKTAKAVNFAQAQAQQQQAEQQQVGSGGGGGGGSGGMSTGEGYGDDDDDDDDVDD